MTAQGIKTGKVNSPKENNPSPVTRAILFLIPSLVITLASIFLFTVLTNFTPQEQNIFSTIIITAVILSLVGTSPMQLLAYRMIDEAENTRNRAVSRVVKNGILYSLVSSLVISALFYPYFINLLHFPAASFGYFIMLLFLYSLVWVITAVFWATEQYQYPAVIFTVSYMIVFVLSYGTNMARPEYTILGYTAGVASLTFLSWITIKRAFGKFEPGPAPKSFSIWKLMSQNVPAIFFHVFYVLAIFLSQIIVWTSQGITAGQGLVVTGAYTTGSFLGAIPIFCVATIAYFSARAKPLVKELYQGTYSNIERRLSNYKHLYGKGLSAMLITGVILVGLVAVLVQLFFRDIPGVMRIAMTVAPGALFFAIVVYNSMVLPLFGRIKVSTLSMLVICLGELMAIPFVTHDIWYAAAGFFIGSFAGCLISQISVLRLFSAPEYNLFRFATLNSGK